MIRKIEKDHILYRFALWAMICLFFSCQQEERTAAPTMSVQITDSIFISHAYQLQFMDIASEDGHLLLQDGYNKSLLITDQEGNIRQEIYYGSEDDGQPGPVLAAAGFLPDGRVAIASSRGVFVYDSAGEIAQFIPRPFRFPDLMNRDLFGYYVDSVLHLAYTCEPFHGLSEPGPELNAILVDYTVYVEKFRAISVLNTETNSLSFAIPFEQNSYFKQENNEKPPVMTPFFARSDSLLYAIISPDPLIHVYNMRDSFRRIDHFPIQADHWGSLPVSGFLTEQILKTVAVYSLVVDNDRLLISYGGAISDQTYTQLSKEEKLSDQAIAMEHVQNYLCIYEDDEKVSGDVLLPDRITTILCPIGENTYLAKPGKGMVEYPDKEVFYVVKLEAHNS